jgi:hypothetical protein
VPVAFLVGMLLHIIEHHLLGTIQTHGLKKMRTLP